MWWPLWCLPLLGAMGLQDTPAYHVLFHSVGPAGLSRATPLLNRGTDFVWRVYLVAVPWGTGGRGSVGFAYWKHGAVVTYGDTLVSKWSQCSVSEGGGARVGN